MDRSSPLGLELDKTLKTIQDTFAKTFIENEIDLTLEQWVILDQIKALGDEASQADVVKLNFRNRATTSRVIGGLIKKELLTKERFEGDQKRFKLSFTEKGEAYYAKVLPVAMDLRGLATNKISKGDIATFLKVLEQLRTNYQI